MTRLDEKLLWEEMNGLRAGCAQPTSNREDVNKLFTLAAIIVAVAFVVACFTVPDFWSQCRYLLSHLMDDHCLQWLPDGTCARWML